MDFHKPDFHNCNALSCNLWDICHQTHCTMCHLHFHQCKTLNQHWFIIFLQVCSSMSLMNHYFFSTLSISFVIIPGSVCHWKKLFSWGKMNMQICGNARSSVKNCHYHSSVSHHIHQQLLWTHTVDTHTQTPFDSSLVMGLVPQFTSFRKLDHSTINAECNTISAIKRIAWHSCHPSMTKWLKSHCHRSDKLWQKWKGNVFLFQECRASHNLSCCCMRTRFQNRTKGSI